MRMLFPAALIASLLAGCASTPDRRAQLDPLVGQSETDAVRALGVPDRSFEANGHKFLAFVDRRVDSYGGIGVFAGYGRVPGSSFGRMGFDAPSEIMQRVCETTLELVDGRVSGYVLRGNACF
jgi:hypothetical protein